VGVVLDAAFKRHYRLPGSVKVHVELDGERHFLRPDATHGTDHVRAAFTLTPFGGVDASRSQSTLDVAELVDPEAGCTERGFLGLTCSCAAYAPDLACRHLRALVAAGLLRPAPAWDEPGSEAQDLAVPGTSDEEEVGA
jgi:hypothetical protein